ncbi:MAG: DUF1150 family protein [Rhodobacterales bacterium]|jgi:hypothetical protein|nr:DUF1150 family protein [Pseudomonadota bacterium]MDA1284911.1 DUF1150 family protein [Pseudomonadota bacterium]NQW14555.1 DUF1150 family protein [Rhodobacter sp.]HBN29764.1 DUF1150 domain-containing protein [Paracoccaceae bacterium]
MDQKFEFEDRADAPIVYIREVLAADLPPEVQAHLQGLKSLYAVHDVEGHRLALVRDRKLAFVLARQNDLAPVSVN